MCFHCSTLDKIQSELSEGVKVQAKCAMNEIQLQVQVQQTWFLYF